MGSGLFDYYREPYAVYESMKGVYTQVLISLEWEQEPHVIGREKKYGSCQFLPSYIPKDRPNLWSVFLHKALSYFPPFRSRENSTEILTERTWTETLVEDSAQVRDQISWILPGDYVGSYVISLQ